MSERYVTLRGGPGNGQRFPVSDGQRTIVVARRDNLRVGFGVAAQCMIEHLYKAVLHRDRKAKRDFIVWEFVR